MGALTVLLLGILFCSQALASVVKVESNKVASKVSSGDFDIIVDVRGLKEYEAGHIPGALHLPGFTSTTKLAGCENKKIGVYCWTGPDRATPTANALHRAGFKHVYDLGGLQFMANMTSAKGASGPMPTCSTPFSYLRMGVKMSGISASQLDVQAQESFRQAIAAHAGNVCGADADAACGMSDVAIHGLYRRDASAKICFSLKIKAASKPTAMNLKTTVASAAFLSDLTRRGALSSVTGVSVTREPYTSSTIPKVIMPTPAPTPAGPVPVAPAKVSSLVTAGDFDIIVDVRSAAEYNAGHIPGALHLPGFTSTKKLKGCENKKIGVYCWTGPDRATPTANALYRAGFKHVYDLGGLQLMKGMKTETGKWDSKLPKCSLYKKGCGGRGNAKTLVIVLGVIIFLVIAFTGFMMWRRRKSREAVVADERVTDEKLANDKVVPTTAAFVVTQPSGKAELALQVVQGVQSPLPKDEGAVIHVTAAPQQPLQV